MQDQNVLTQERVTEVVVRTRFVLSATTSADPRVSLLLSAYGRFSKDQSVHNFNYLLKVLQDTETRVFASEAQADES
jgi:hypothetical protein